MVNMTNGRWSATPWKVISYPYSPLDRFVLADRHGRMLPVSIGNFSDMKDALNHALRPLFRLGRILYLRCAVHGLSPDTKVRTVCYPKWSAEAGEWTYMIEVVLTRAWLIVRECELKEKNK